MRRLFSGAVALSVVMMAYLASPFVTAWWIREAARTGDTAYLARAIDWPGVRATLKPDLSRIALDLPMPDEAAAVNPGLWQRLKAYWGQGAINRAVDSYLTPEGLPQLFAARKAYRDYTGETQESAVLSTPERARRFLSRIKRAEFTSLTTFEIDMVDRNDENRMFAAKLILTATGWMLKELRIKSFGPSRTTSTTVTARNPSPAAHAWSMGGFVTRAHAATSTAPATHSQETRSSALRSFWEKAKAAAR